MKGSQFNMHKGFVLMNCDLGAEEYIIEELTKISEVSQAYVTFGAYDIIAEINTNSQNDFEETVSMKIRRLTRVVSTMTLTVVNSE
ncbi:AsnC domain containing protein [Marine Group I thaumarchaeote SCGC AAA799-O18]|jgi:DNA-binding Lrp family transcriptional regulator|nr:AsnC domain containing protein [Marine Group I thaumarchaeote SCGC AAA799-O18]